ncbi:hypothetical protein GCM10011348_06710 [Marinobacterium nitratireducens]|uniref:Uncharacterized protein n=1 Tax=Marinobacterium nitratireducens TaxID=518897 RepID=A0A917Z910_9GAMM|nr:hypothetical protein GCM10011348_06710 [Marinobacterium nitratireducens]
MVSGRRFGQSGLAGTRLAGQKIVGRELETVLVYAAAHGGGITRFLVAASEAARLTQVVVLPTPPFWFVTVRILAKVRLSQESANGGRLPFPVPAAGDWT